MSASLPKKIRGVKLRGRRCVRCGKKLEGYRRFFCGEECKRGDYREKKQVKRAQARSEAYCPYCGRWGASGKGPVTGDRGPSGEDRRGNGGRGAGQGKTRRKRARKRPADGG
jgi:hypothetical protein